MEEPGSKQSTLSCLGPLERGTAWQSSSAIRLPASGLSGTFIIHLGTRLTRLSFGKRTLPLRPVLLLLTAFK